MVKFNQSISNRDYKRAIWIHYFTHKYAFIMPVLGALLLILLLPLWFFYPEFTKEHGLFILLSGLFVLLQPLLYVQTVYRNIRSGPHEDNETVITMGDEYVIVQTETNSASIELADLHSYNISRDFVFLYTLSNHFMLIDKRALMLQQDKGLVRSLDALAIPRRKKSLLRQA